MVECEEGGCLGERQEGGCQRLGSVHKNHKMPVNSESKRSRKLPKLDCCETLAGKKHHTPLQPLFMQQNTQKCNENFKKKLTFCDQRSGKIDSRRIILLNCSQLQSAENITKKCTYKWQMGNHENTIPMSKNIKNTAFTLSERVLIM